MVHRNSVTRVPRRPVRTCVGCRQRAAKQELLRVVVRELESGPALVPDPAGRQPGRGAHLHPTPECLDLALRRRAFARALRVEGGLVGDALTDYLLQAARRSADALEQSGGTRGARPS